MPEKDWIVWLDRCCRVEVERRSRGGRVTGVRIVLLADIDGEMHCVTRHDTSNGFAHRDMLVCRGRLVAKELVEEEDFALALEQAHLDIVNKHGRYLGDYRRKGG